jgi:hypothetical protein
MGAAPLSTSQVHGSILSKSNTLARELENLNTSCSFTAMVAAPLSASQVHGSILPDDYCRVHSLNLRIKNQSTPNPETLATSTLTVNNFEK